MKQVAQGYLKKSRKGFMFPKPDIDNMYWPTDHQVIGNFPQFNNKPNQNISLCDNSESSPALTVQRLFSAARNFCGLEPKRYQIIFCVSNFSD